MKSFRMSKVGILILENEELLKRMNENMAENIHDKREQSVTNKIEGAEIFKSELKSTLAKLNSIKATGPDRNLIENLLALDDIGIGMNTELINDNSAIYRNSYVDQFS